MHKLVQRAPGMIFLVRAVTGERGEKTSPVWRRVTAQTICLSKPAEGEADRRVKRPVGENLGFVGNSNSRLPSRRLLHYFARRVAGMTREDGGRHDA